MTFYDIQNVTFRGEGTIDGQGFMWWVREFLGRNPNDRPRLMQINGGRNIEL